MHTLTHIWMMLRLPSQCSLNTSCRSLQVGLDSCNKEKKINNGLPLLAAMISLSLLYDILSVRIWGEVRTCSIG